MKEKGDTMKRRVSIGWLHLLLLVAPAALAVGAAGCAIIDTDQFSGLAVAKELQIVGIPAEAEILSIADTKRALNDDPIVRLEIEVRPAGQPPFRATIQRFLITYLQVPQFQPGKIIAVRYDPRDPSRAAIDLGPPCRDCRQ
jgi:hypothetical protein